MQFFVKIVKNYSWIVLFIFSGLEANYTFAQVEPDKASFKNLAIQANPSFTGNLSQTIDLLTIPGTNGLDYPISINYNHDINYSKHASWVGVNWNLQIGSISRYVNMLPDDQNQMSFGSSDFNLSNHYSHYIESNGALLGGVYDDFDSYMVNLNNGTIPIVPITDYNANIWFQTEQYKGWSMQYGGKVRWMDLNTEHHLTRWKIENEFGQTYNFGEPRYLTLDNITVKSIDADIFALSNSQGKTKFPYSWDLTDIRGHDFIDVNKDGKVGDEDQGSWVKFNYQKRDNVEVVHNNLHPLPESYTRITLGFESFGGQNSNPLKYGTYGLSNAGSLLDYYSELFYDLATIQTIETPTHIAEFVTKDREDLVYNPSEKAKYLESITLYKKLDNGGKERVSKIVFTYSSTLVSYYNKASKTSNGVNILTLQKLQRFGKTDSASDAEPPYEFTRTETSFSVLYPEGGKRSYNLESDRFQWFTTGLAFGAYHNFQNYFYVTEKYPWSNGYQDIDRRGGFDASMRLKDEKFEDGIGNEYKYSYNYGEGVVSPTEYNSVSSLEENINKNPGLDFCSGQIGYRWVSITQPDSSIVTNKYISSIGLSPKNPELPEIDAVNFQAVDLRESYPAIFKEEYSNNQRVGIKAEFYTGLYGTEYESVVMKNGKEIKKVKTAIPPAVRQQANTLARLVEDGNLRLASDGINFIDYNGDTKEILNVARTNPLKKHYTRVNKSYWNESRIATTIIDTLESVTETYFNPINNLPTKVVQYRVPFGSEEKDNVKVTKYSYAFEQNMDIYHASLLTLPAQISTGGTLVPYYPFDKSFLITPFNPQTMLDDRIVLDAIPKAGNPSIETFVTFPNRSYTFDYNSRITIEQTENTGGIGFWFRGIIVNNNTGEPEFYYPPNMSNPEDAGGGYLVWLNTSGVTSTRPTGVYYYCRTEEHHPVLNHVPPFTDFDDILCENEWQKLFRKYAAPNGNEGYLGNFSLEVGRSYQLTVKGTWSYGSGTGVEVYLDNKLLFRFDIDLTQGPSSGMTYGNGGIGLMAYMSKATFESSLLPERYHYVPGKLSESIYELSVAGKWQKSMDIQWQSSSGNFFWMGHNDPTNQTTTYKYDSQNRLVFSGQNSNQSTSQQYTKKSELPVSIAKGQYQSYTTSALKSRIIRPADIPTIEDHFESGSNPSWYLPETANATISQGALQLNGENSFATTNSYNQIQLYKDGYHLSFNIKILTGSGFAGFYLDNDIMSTTGSFVNNVGAPDFFTNCHHSHFVSFKTEDISTNFAGIYTQETYYSETADWARWEDRNWPFSNFTKTPLKLKVGVDYLVSVKFYKENLTNFSSFEIEISDPANPEESITKFTVDGSFLKDTNNPRSETDYANNPVVTSFGLFAKNVNVKIDNVIFYNLSSYISEPITEQYLEITEHFSPAGFSDAFSAGLDNWNLNGTTFYTEGDSLLKLGSSVSGQIMTSKIKNENSGTIPFFLDLLVNYESNIGVIFNADAASPTTYQRIWLKGNQIIYTKNGGGSQVNQVIFSTLAKGKNRKLVVKVDNTLGKIWVWLDWVLIWESSDPCLTGNYFGIYSDGDQISSVDNFRYYKDGSTVVDIVYDQVTANIKEIVGIDDKRKKFTYDGLGRLTGKQTVLLNYGSTLQQVLNDNSISYDWGRKSNNNYIFDKTAPNSIQVTDYLVNPSQPAIGKVFYDGLGRTVQMKSKVVGSSTNVIISAPIYDHLGRKAGDFVPIKVSGSNLNYQTDLFSTTLNELRPRPGQSLSSTGLIYTTLTGMGYSTSEASKAYSFTSNDALGRPIFSVLPGHVNGKVWMSYGSAKNLVLPTGLGEVRGMDLVRTTFYDKLGSVSHTLTDLLGREVASAKVTGSSLAWTLKKYSNIEQIIKVTHPNATFTTYDYDNHGNLIKKNPPYFDTPVEYRYDQYDRVRFQRDANDQASGVFHYFKYNYAGSLIETGFVSQNSTNDFKTISTLTENPASDLPVTGKTVEYQYFYGPENMTAGASVAYGKLAKEIGLINKDTQTYYTRYYSYNKEGQVIWTIDEFPGLQPKKITYTNDRKGNLKTLSYEDGKKDAFTQFFDYNSAGQMETTYAGRSTNTVAFPRRKINTYTYSADGKLNQTRFYNSFGSAVTQTVDFSFGIEGWMKKINDLTSATDLYAMDYSYLTNGQISGINQRMDGAFSPDLPINQSVADETTFGETYIYDNASRLTSASSSGAVVNKYNSTYSYDLMGNITNLTRKSNVSFMDKLTYQYDSKNRLAAVTDEIQNAAFPNDYDAPVNAPTTLDQLKFSENFSAASFTETGWSVAVWNSHSFTNENGGVKIKTATLTGLNTSVFASLKSIDIPVSAGKGFILTGNVSTSGYNARVRLEWKKITLSGGTVGYPIETILRSDVKTVINPANGYQSLFVTAPENANYVVIYLELKGTSLTEWATFDDLTLSEVGGFKYDANGNTIFDRNRGISSISYNGFNLPTKLNTVSGQTAEYAYSGSGSRILKKVNGTSNWYLRTVSGEVLAEIEKNGSTEKLKYINLFGNNGVTGEWTPSVSGMYNYHFNLKDHLGNNKVTFTDKAVAADGFENQIEGPGLPTGIWATVNGPFSPTSRVATVSDLLGGKALTLTTAENNYPYVYVIVQSAKKDVIGSKTYFLSAWTKASSTSAGIYVGVAWYNSSNSLISESWVVNNAKHLSWLQSGGVVTAPATATQVVITLKNVSSLASTAFFDEIWLGESSDRVLVEQTQDYYPYGSISREMNYSNTATFDLIKKFKYQGKERDVESGYDFFEARLFDSQTIRFMQVDPIAEKFSNLSPFVGMNNNPILIIDLDGMAGGPYETYKRLSPEEKNFLRNNPILVSATIYLNSKRAESATEALFTQNGGNDISDAFRHSLWQALNTQKVGLELTNQYSQAHEEIEGNPENQKAMDTHNNSVGIIIGLKNPNANIKELQKILIEALNNGTLVALDPITGKVIRTNEWIEKVLQGIEEQKKADEESRKKKEEEERRRREEEEKRKQEQEKQK